jgi:hypothetical protein
LIQAAVGLGGGSGGFLTKRSGLEDAVEGFLAGCVDPRRGRQASTPSFAPASRPPQEFFDTITVEVGPYQGPEAGVLGPLTGILGAMMALEVIREIFGYGEGLVGRLVLVDSLGNSGLWLRQSCIISRYVRIRDIPAGGAIRESARRGPKDEVTAAEPTQGQRLVGLEVGPDTKRDVVSLVDQVDAAVREMELHAD